MLGSELRLILKTSSVTPDFFYVFYRILSFLPSVKVLKKSVCGKLLGANVFKWGSKLQKRKKKETPFTPAASI